jgi:Ca-activated chloride channel family protein
MRILVLALFTLGCQDRPEAQVNPIIGDLPAPRAVAPEDRSLAPYFFTANEDPDVDPLPLRSTRADVHIAGAIAEVRVTQVYKNQGQRTLEAVYVFPLSTRAAVHAMKMRIGERSIDARIGEREEARGQFEAARRQGRTASLLEQDRPNVFRMSVANILPGDEIRVELSYVELIVPSEHVYEFVFPTVVSPRYAKGSAQSSYLHAGVPADHTFALDALVESAVPIHRIGCASHAASMEFPSPSQSRVTVAESDDAGNRDFILRWQLEGSAIEGGLLLGESQGEKYFLLAMEPPARVETQAIVPREYIFVVDVSGSMSGFPLDTAKSLMRGLLSGLRPIDRFDILSFAGGSQLYAPTSQPADADNLHAAAEFMEKMEGGGGTELLPSLKRALALPRMNTSRIVVLITDGFVDVEKESFELVRGSLGQANLFAFGIGTSVNRFLIEGLARAGQGESFVVTNPAVAASAAARFQSYVSAPVLRDLRIELEGFGAEDVTPASPPDLFAERPVAIHGRYHGERSGSITISGQAAGGAFSQTVDLTSATRMKDGDPLRLLWARDRLTWLQDLSGAGDRGAYKDEITRIGLTHGLMTQYTSFVAVDSAVRANGNPTTVEQPLPMPAGVSDHAIGGGLLGLLGSKEASSLGSIFTRDSALGNDALSGLMASSQGFAVPALGGRRAQVPDVHVGSVQVRGSLDKEVIRRVLRRHLNELRFCYEKELLNLAALAAGRLVLHFTINGAGAVVASSSTFGNAAVEQCAAAAVRRWSFPAGNGPVMVTYPVELKP